MLRINGETNTNAPIHVIFEYMLHTYLEFQNGVSTKSCVEEIDMIQEEVCEAWKDSVVDQKFFSDKKK